MTAEATKALVKAQTEMGKAVKNARNPHLKSAYADLGAVMDACFDALHSNGFAILQPGGHDEHGPYVETIFAHETGHEFRSRCYLLIGKPDMQGVGSAWTYARRYGLLGMAGLAPEDDDGEGTKRPRQEPKRNDPPQPKQDEPFDAPGTRDRIKKAIASKMQPRDLDALWQHPATVETVAKLHPAMQAELQTAYNDRMAEVTPDLITDGERAA